MNTMKMPAGLDFRTAERITIRLWMLACIAMVVLPTGCSPSETGGTAASSSVGGDNFSIVNDDNPEMVAAIAQARATLPRFWKTLEQPKDGETDFALKVETSNSPNCPRP